MKKKNPNIIADEELLKLLENLEDTTEEATSSFDSGILAFVQSFNLKPGKDKIIKKQLYNLYKLWNKGIQKLHQHAFTIQLSYFLDHNNKYFFVDSSAIQIGEFIQQEKQKNKVNKVKSKYWHTHFQSFLQDTKLEEGTNYIELEILYFLYQLWRKKTKKKTNISRKQLIPILDLYFDVRIISNGDNLWVGLNDQIKNLISNSEVKLWRRTRAKSKKNSYNPKEEWKKFTLYWEEKEKISKG